MSDLLVHLAARSALEGRILALLAPTVAGLGYDMVRLRLLGGRNPRSPLTLQIMAERPDGTMTVEDCSKISEAVSALLDVEDPIEREYSLEVSSPGIDRPLTRPKDFAEHAGHEAKFEMGVPLEGRKRFRGAIVALVQSGEAVEIEAVDSKGTVERVALPLADLADARLVLTDALIEESLRRRPPPPEGEVEGEEVEIENPEAPEPANRNAAKGRSKASPKDSPQRGARKPRGDA